MFWSCMLLGTAGHTYGANGVWQVNTREKPFGRSPHGMSWGDTPWEDAYQLPGSSDVALGKRLLSRCEWWRFEHHSEWVEPRWNKDNYAGAYAAGIPREVRVIFFPLSWWGIRHGQRHREGRPLPRPSDQSHGRKRNGLRASRTGCEWRLGAAGRQPTVEADADISGLGAGIGSVRRRNTHTLQLFRLSHVYNCDGSENMRL